MACGHSIGVSVRDRDRDRDRVRVRVRLAFGLCPFAFLCYQSVLHIR